MAVGTTKVSSQTAGAGLAHFALDYPHDFLGGSLVVLADSFDWLSRIPEASIHAMVTDPPFGVKEFQPDELKKRSAGRGGIWRIPPAFDGHKRSPLPRFTALNQREREELAEFFLEFGKLAARCMRPGGHMMIAGNAFLSQIVFSALVHSGLEYRGEIVRLIRTLRGGDRPKNAETEFPDVSSLPRGCFEPWGLFRRALPPGMKVSDCLREFGTGGLRRTRAGLPFEDVIKSEKTPRHERAISTHPSLKPQSLLRQLVHAALPLGEGLVCDPFSGSGATVAACEAQGLVGIGVERRQDYFDESRSAVPRLAALQVAGAAQVRFDLRYLAAGADSER